MALAAQEKHPQVLERTYRKAFDQHGRQWGANIHGRSHDPVDTLQPQGWSAPFIPAPHYVRWVYDAEEGRYSVKILYDQQIADLDAALRDWKAELIRTGVQLNGQAFDSRKPSPEVLFKIGPRPMSADIPRAAQAGDPWILGKTDKKPQWAYRLFADDAPDALAFMKEPAVDEVETGTPTVRVVRSPVKKRRKRQPNKPTAPAPAVATMTLE